MRAGTTRLYLSGARAGEVAAVFEGTPLDARVVEGDMAASALKMTYAAWTKGAAALLLAIEATAASLGVAPLLHEEWELSQPDAAGRLEAALAAADAKAWRWVAEMREIAGFLGPDHPAALIYEGLARWFEHLANDVQGEGTEAAQIVAFAESCRAKK